MGCVLVQTGRHSFTGTRRIVRRRNRSVKISVGQETFRRIRADLQKVFVSFGNEKNDNRVYCFSKENEIYLVYVPSGGKAEIRLADAKGYSTELFNPRTGGALKAISSEQRNGKILLEAPADPTEDWLFVVRKKPAVKE